MPPNDTHALRPNDTHALRYSDPLATREMPVFNRGNLDELRSAFLPRTAVPVEPAFQRANAVPTRPFKTLQSNEMVRLAGAPIKKLAVQGNTSLFAYCPLGDVTDLKSVIVEMHTREDMPISCIHFLSDAYLLIGYVQPNNMALLDIIDVFANQRVRTIDSLAPIIDMIDIDSKVVVLSNTGVVTLIDLSVADAYVWTMPCNAVGVATNVMFSANGGEVNGEANGETNYDMLVVSTTEGVFSMCWQTGRLLARLSNLANALIAFDTSNPNALALASGCNLTLLTLPSALSQRAHSFQNLATVVASVVTNSPIQELLFVHNEIVTTHACERWMPAMSIEEWNARPHYVQLRNNELPSQMPTENVARLWTVVRNTLATKLVPSGHLYFDSPLSSVTVVANTVFAAAEKTGAISMWNLWPVVPATPTSAIKMKKTTMSYSALTCSIR